jgi:hypothetical protein
VTYPFPPATPPAKRSKLPLVIGGIAAAAVLTVGGSAVGALVAGSHRRSSAQPSATVATAPAAPIATTEETTPETTTTTRPATTKPVATKAPSYKRLTAREWKKIAKSPDGHIGEHYVIYGVVTQFDAATGDEGFRADVDAVHHAEAYDYETNTILSGDAADLADLVEDDQFRAKVTVLGSYSYDTQIGGNTTAPQLSVDSIEVL